MIGQDELELDGTSISAVSEAVSQITGASVTTIGDNAFWLCQSLTSISIPNSVSSIGEDALGNCPSLTAIEVAAGNSSFKRCL